MGQTGNNRSSLTSATSRPRATATVRQTATPAPVTYIVTDGVNMRDCPRTSCDVNGTAERGMLLTVIDTEGGESVGGSSQWLKIRRKDGSTSYIHSDFAIQGSSLPATAAPTNPPRVWDCTRDLYTCDYFSSRSEMRSYWNACPGDPSNLDGNNDGEYCE